MFYSGWQALYGTYCIGTNKLSIYRRYFIILLISGGVIQISAEFVPTYPDFIETALAMQSCSNVTIITQKDISSSGYVIDKEGIYCIKEDIYFKPDKPGRGAITVKANRVSISFNGIHLTQKGTTANTHGIVIDGALETSIYGVNVSKFTGNGIYVINSTDVVFESCNSSENKGKLGNGFLLDKCDGAFFILCTANNNSGKGISISTKNLYGENASFLLESVAAKGNSNNRDIDIS